MSVPKPKTIVDTPVLAAVQTVGGVATSTVNALDELFEGGVDILTRRKQRVEGHDWSQRFAFSRQGVEDVVGPDRSLPSRAVSGYNMISHLTKDGIRAVTMQPGLDKQSFSNN